jgi:tetratricopeptide (TPR) repeat protein
MQLTSHRSMRPLPSPVRKTTFLLTVGALLFGLVACGSSPPIASASQSRATLAPAATDSLLRRAKSLLREATDNGSIDSLQQARALAERATNGSAHRALAHYYVGLADYRMLNQFSEDDEKRRERTLKDAISHLQRATKIDAEMADAWALLTGCYGQMMGMHPMRSMSLGPKANEAMKKAKTLAPKNPRVWIISGTQDYFTPSMFGGDKEQALQKFKKAARLAEQESVDDPLMPDWGHAEAHAWIGIAHMNAERYDRARTAFETALDLNPNYGWVKSALLPELEKRQS